jgi:hypothetical protein
MSPPISPDSQLKNTPGEDSVLTATVMAVEIEQAA